MQTNTLEGKKQYARGRGYTLVADENFNRQTKVILVEDSTGIEYSVYWGNFRNGATPRTTTLNHKRKEVADRGYTLLATENVGTNGKVNVMNNETRYVYTVVYNDFIIRGDREKVGSMSKGEAYIYAFLEANLKEGYTFNYQEKVTYEDKKGYFDFSINKDNRIVAFIEYNGKQHYEVVPHFGEESFRFTQESDRLKEAYAEATSIPLLVIPYTNKEIAETIQKCFPELVEAQLKPFKPKRLSKGNTTLDEKKEIAKERGYIIATEKNFTTMDKVKLINTETGEEWTPKWFDFINGAVPVKEDHKRKIKGSLEDKKKIANFFGYELLETENFTVKKRVKLMIDNELKELVWEPIYRRYQKELKQSGMDL